MLAIDRLRRINGNVRRLSGSGCRPTASSTANDVSDSPLLCGRHAVRPSTAPVVGNDPAIHAVSRTVAVSVPSTASGIYSVSSGGIVQQSAIVDGCHTRNQPPKHGASSSSTAQSSSADIVRSTSSFRSDDCNGSTSTSSTAASRGGNQLNPTAAFVSASGAASTTVDSTIQHRHPVTSSAPVVRSGHTTLANRVTVGRGGDSSDGDLTPTNERRTASAVDTASSTHSSSTVREIISTASRPSAQVAPLPKPIPTC